MDKNFYHRILGDLFEVERLPLQGSFNTVPDDLKEELKKIADQCEATRQKFLDRFESTNLLV